MDYEFMEAITSNMTVRSERSLGLLTIKFVTLLQEAKDGVVNLKEVRSQELLLHFWSAAPTDYNSSDHCC